MERLRGGVAVLLAVALSGCGGGSGARPASTGAAVVPNAPILPSGSGRVTLTIAVPPASSGPVASRRAKYVSAATQSLAVTIGAAAPANINVAAGSPGCQSTETVTPSAAAWQEFPIDGGAQPRGITVGPDSALWFDEDNGEAVSRLTTSGVYTPYGGNGRTSNDILSAGGSLWIADVYGAATLGNSTTNGLYSELALGTAAGSGPSQTNAWLLALGPDSAIWFTEFDPNNNSTPARIGRVMTSSSATTEWATMGSDYGIVSVPSDSAVWFTESNGTNAWIGRISSASQTLTNEFPLAALGAALPGPVALGPPGDGGLWFTDSANFMDRFDLVSHALTRTPIGSGSGFDHIVAGADGALYFTETNTGKIGRITTSGTVNEFVIPTASSAPTGITLGPDNAIWFAEQNRDKIGRLQFPSTTTCTATLNAPTGTQNVTVTSYDAVGGAAGTGHALASATISATVVPNATNTIALTLNGIVNSISLALLSAPSGCPLTGTAALSLYALDAAGNLIVGPGSYIDSSGNPLTITLTDNDHSGHSALSATTFTAPPATQPVLNLTGTFASPTVTATVTGGTISGASTASVTIFIGC
jgi:virginiamycin B lyase